MMLVQVSVDAVRRHPRAAVVRVMTILTLIAVLVLMLEGPVVADVAVSDVPLTGWRVNGDVRAVLVSDGTTYVGGNFSQAVAPDGTTRPRANLAAFDTATGDLREQFRADTDGYVRALATDGTTVWVGGSFRDVAGERRDRLAAVDADTGALLSFRADASSNVYALDHDQGRLFVGGSFGWIRGIRRSRLAALDGGSGAVDAQWDPGSDQTVHAVKADLANSVVYVGGNFSIVDGAPRTGLAAIDANTGDARAPVFSNQYDNVQALALDDTGDRLFGAIGGAGNQVAAWNTSSGARVWRQRADGDVQAVAHHAGTVYFGFHDSFEGDTTLRLLAADAASGDIDPDFRPSWDRYWGVQALSADATGLAAGGDFTRVSGVSAQGVAIFPVDDSAPPPPPPPPPTETGIYVTESSAWRYLDDGSTPTNWIQRGFNDSAWATGTPEFGYGDGDETTVLSFGPDQWDKHITSYFRTSFDVDALPTAATVELLADDGAIVYLNGAELVRDNMPNGTITSSTLAASNRSGDAERAIRSFTIDESTFVEGTNVLAVAVHQDNPTSSDLSFELELTGEVPAQ